MDFQSITLNYPQSKRSNKFEFKKNGEIYSVNHKIKDQVSYNKELELGKKEFENFVKNNKILLDKIAKRPTEFGCANKRFWVLEFDNKKKIFCQKETKEIGVFFNSLSELVLKN